jgi:hypothetical protein
MKKIMDNINGDESLPFLLRLAARDLPLSEAEFHCFCDANNGTRFDPRDLENSFGLNVVDSKPDGLDEIWGVDLTALARKLDSLTLLQKCALLAAMDGFFKRNRCHT